MALTLSIAKLRQALSTGRINGTIPIDGTGTGGSTPTGPAGGDLIGTYPNPTIGTGKVTSAGILDGTIVDADVNTSAALAVSKLAAGTNGQVIKTTSGVAAWGTLTVGDSKFNVMDYGALGDGSTDDTTAIQAAINDATAAPGGVVIFPPTHTYMVSAPLEILDRCRLEGIEARNTIIKATSGFSKTQMIRNWTAADWNTGIGESDGRTCPSDYTHSGTHGVVPYLQIANLHIQSNSHSNISLLAWCAPQESSYVQNAILDSQLSVDGNDGVWGIDFQDGTSHTFNGGVLRDLVLYGEGWERQISIDGSAGGGSDLHMENIIFSPAQVYHSLVYVNRVIDVSMIQCHWENETNTASHAHIYLVSALGFMMTDNSASVKTANQKPFLVLERRAPGTTNETPPSIKGQKFYYSSGTPLTCWPGGFITDLWNTIPGVGPIGASNSGAMGLVHHYDGESLSWTDHVEGRYEHYFKTPDIPTVTDVQLNSTYLSCAGSATVNNQGYTTPDHPDFDLTDVDLRCLIQPAAWAQAATATLIAKNGTANYSYQFSITTAGKLQFTYSTGGTSTTALQSSVAAAIAGNVWVRVVANVTNTIFYTSPDAATWTQLGTTQAALSGSIFNSTRVAAVGENSGTDGRYAGRILKAEFRTATGTLMSSLDLTGAQQGAAIVDPQGHSWAAGAASTILNDALLDLRKITPGANGQVLTMVSGVPTWV